MSDAEVRWITLAWGKANSIEREWPHNCRWLPLPVSPVSPAGLAAAITGLGSSDPGLVDSSHQSPPQQAWDANIAPDSLVENKGVIE